MTIPIFRIVDDLPTSGLTVRLLHALDWVVPGEYQNLVGFENTIRKLTGVTDTAVVQKIGDRAIALYDDPRESYQRALWLYQTVDQLQGVSGFAALVSKIGESASLLSFLNRLTPKSDTVQAIDLSLKLSAEISAHYLLSESPGAQAADFVRVLTDYKHEALMRMAALIVCDGLIPLGPDFVEKSLSLLQSVGPAGLETNGRFRAIRTLIPGASILEQFAFVQQGLTTAGRWMTDFVSARQLGAGEAADKLKTTLAGIEGRFDYLGAILDLAVNYFEHTGVQTVARKLITRAAQEI